MWLAAKYPEKVRSLSLHSAWPRTDRFLKTVVEGWQIIAKSLDSVPEMTPPRVVVLFTVMTSLAKDSGRAPDMVSEPVPPDT